MQTPHFQNFEWFWKHRTLRIVNIELFDLFVRFKAFFKSSIQDPNTSNYSYLICYFRYTNTIYVMFTYAKATKVAVPLEITLSKTFYTNFTASKVLKNLFHM